MAILDAKPTESPPGFAIASGALWGALLDTLIDKGTISRYDAQVFPAVRRMTPPRSF